MLTATTHASLHMARQVQVNASMIYLEAPSLSQYVSVWDQQVVLFSAHHLSADIMYTCMGLLVEVYRIKNIDS